jgi:hypothetical protein
MTKITKRWFAGIMRAIIQGASTSVAVTLSQVVVTEHIGWRVVGISAIITSAGRLAEFLRRNPLPGVEGEGTIEMKAVELPK